MNPFFDELGERLREAGARRGVRIAAPQLSPRLAEELLELARVAAHTRERRFAPLASFLAGEATERLRAAGLEEEAVVDALREVRRELETAASEAGS
ncbi:MAG TPA: DUF6457 domain-containing protein [Candidatus Dormibacteraeota bacterium]|jgi:hypothetical protein|nr:DUF6457 domain-containing protein [Candidatus Dormibacteraeota bacterium]